MNCMHVSEEASTTIFQNKNVLGNITAHAKNFFFFIFRLFKIEF